MEAAARAADPRFLASVVGRIAAVVQVHVEARCSEQPGVAVVIARSGSDAVGRLIDARDADSEEESIVAAIHAFLSRFGEAAEDE